MDFCTSVIMKIKTLLIATWLAGAAFAVPVEEPEKIEQQQLSKRFAIGGAISALGALTGLFGSKSNGLPLRTGR